jgi:pimeloyl-ACP methyl ester carboxylesterase
LLPDTWSWRPPSRFPEVTGFAVLTLAFSVGCAAVPYATTTSARPPGDSQGIIFVANGAGGSNATTQALERAVEEEHLPLTVQTLAWSYGYGMIVLDQRDGMHAHQAGLELAATVLAYRRQFPGKEVYLLGHSAGCAVVLAAAAGLPPGSVDRIVLLAPSVSANHDIRPALSAARLGVHVFYSRRDVAFLGLGTALVGTSDGFGAAAGRVGFRPRIESPADLALAAKLHQYAWDPSAEWTGNRGGHFGAQADRYVRAYVLPLFLNDISAH